MVYLILFWTFLKIGLFGFGGGYAIISLIKHEVVDIHCWIGTQEFTDILAISQITPGPIVINCATYVGYSATDNILGSIIATIAVCLPSLILITLICMFLKKFRTNKYINAAFWGIKPVVLGLLAAATLVLVTGENFIDWYSYIIFAVVAVLSYFKMNPITLMCLAGIAGYFIY